MSHRNHGYTQKNNAVKLSAHCGLDHCAQYGSAAVILKASSQSNRCTTILRHTDISVRQTILLHRKDLVKICEISRSAAE